MQEDAQNFFLLFELDLNGFTLPEFVRHPMELEASLEKKKQMFKYFEFSSERLLLWLEILNRAMDAGRDLWRLSSRQG